VRGPQRKGNPLWPRWNNPISRTAGSPKTNLLPGNQFILNRRISEAEASSQRRGACTLTFGTLCSFQGADHAPTRVPATHRQPGYRNGVTRAGPSGPAFLRVAPRADAEGKRSGTASGCQPALRFSELGRSRPPGPGRAAGVAAPRVPDGSSGTRVQQTCWFRGDLLSHTVSRAVPSALEGLTSGFGMGPGVPPPL
jgi:hypothetical protein